VSSLDRHDEYDQATLDLGDVDPDPLRQFAAWLGDAEAAGLADPNAMVLSTVRDGRPTSRTVLLKGIVDRRFEFVTNDGSRKGRALAANPAVSLTFPWYALQRQILIDGVAERAPETVSDRYWASRPRGSQLAGWASDQSAVIADRDALDAKVQAVEARFGASDPVPRPPFWHAWLVAPTRIEFWQGRHSRLHDRLVYLPRGDTWRIERIQP
jgi:pyridoxamine 5'-phosphate oxidase